MELEREGEKEVQVRASKSQKGLKIPAKAKKVQTLQACGQSVPKGSQEMKNVEKASGHPGRRSGANETGAEISCRETTSDKTEIYPRASVAINSDQWWLRVPKAGRLRARILIRSQHCTHPCRAIRGESSEWRAIFE